MLNEAGASQGVEPTVTPQAEVVVNPGTNVTVEPAAATPQNADNGKAARLEQELGKMNRALKSLGIDPESDVVDKINRGILSWDDVLNRQSQPQQTAPPKRASERLAEVYQKVNMTDPTADDFKAALAAMVDVVKEQETKDSAQAAQQSVSAVKQTVFNVIDNDQMHKTLPPDLAELEKSIFYSSTDHLVSNEAFQSPNPNRFFNPETYKYYAELNAGRYNKLRDFYINQGRQMEKQAQQPTTTTTKPNVVPMSPSTGVSPAAPAGPLPTKANMKLLAQQYLSQMASRV